MAHEQDQHLEQSRKPIAIVHEGFFVCANAAFLERLGYASFEALQAVPLLNLVGEEQQERLRRHLDQGKKTAGTDSHLPEARLTLLRADGLPVQVVSTAFRTRHGGEDCVQLTLQAPVDESLLGRVRDLPWKLYLSIAFLVLFTVLPSSLLLRLNINNAPAVYFPDDEPAVVLDRQLRERFPNDQVIVLLFEGVALFSDGFLSAYNELAKTLRAHPLVDDVLSVTTQDHIAGTEDDFIVEPLIDVRELAASRPAERQQRATEDRFSRGALAAADGSALAMVVIPQEISNSLERLGLEEEVLRAVEQARLSGYLTARTGWITVDVAELRAMLRDNMIFIPATVSIGLLLIWWLFRRWLAVMLSGVAIGVVTNSTVAFYVLADQPFSLISSIVPPLLSALTVAALVHFFNALYQGSRRGLAGKERVARALAEVDRPARFTALTTVLGLASLATSPIVPIKALGLISAAGTALIYVVVYRILPNLVSRWDNSPWPTARGGLRVMDAVVGLLYRSALRRPGVVVGVVVLALAVGVPQIAHIKVETSLQEFFDYEHPVRRDTRHIEAVLQGTMPLAVTFDAAARDGLKDPASLALIRDFQQWVEQLPEVDRAFSPVDFIEEMHWAFHAEQPEFRRLPSDAEVISQYLFVYDGNDLYDFIDRDFQHAQVNLSLNVHSANEIAAVMAQIRGYLQQQVGDRLQWEIAGAGRLFADMEELLVNGQVYSLWGALGLIFLSMLLLWRSFGAAVLCMIPNLSPVLLMFIVMGAAGIWLDMGTAMIASVAVGIAVDDTIHVYHGFRSRIARGIRPTTALVRTYRQAGRAVVTTTVILSAQFIILLASQFVPMSNFGLLTTVGLVSALLFDLTLLPALLILIYGPRSPLAGILGRRQPGGRPATAQTAAAAEPASWSGQRKVALVKEIYRGNLSVSKAAQDYGLTRGDIEAWLQVADAALLAALGDGCEAGPAECRERLQALSEAFEALQAENQELRRLQQRLLPERDFDHSA